MTTRAKTLERIRKVLELARAAGTEHEAAAAAATAQRLLADHRLSLDDVTRETVVDLVVRVEPGWALQLFSVVAGGCGCALGIIETSTKDPVSLGRLAGMQLDCATALRLYYRTKRTLEFRVSGAWDAHVMELTDPVAGRHPILDEPGAEERWRHSFLYGAIEVVQRTLRTGGTVPGTNAALMSGTALTLVTMSREIAAAQANAYLAKHYGTGRYTKDGATTFTMGAYRQGRKTTL